MATTTVTTTAAHDTRILAALTKVIGRTAVQADYKAWLIDKTKLLVLETEKADARNTAEAGVTPIGPN